MTVSLRTVSEERLPLRAHRGYRPSGSFRDSPETRRTAVVMAAAEDPVPLCVKTKENVKSPNGKGKCPDATSTKVLVASDAAVSLLEDRIATLETDRDEDGNSNNQDNCPDESNPTQADVDGDGQGDACDTYDERDWDEDGHLNTVDNCPVKSNVTQTDADGDGIGDACDGRAAIAAF